MRITQEQREEWRTETRGSLFNLWLRARTMTPSGALDLDLLGAVAAEYGVDASIYAHLNPGQQRMNVGNRLRRLVPRSIYETDVAPVAADDRDDAGGALPDQLLDTWTVLPHLAVSDLLRLQAAAVEELRARGIVRTANAPLGDYAEHLFARAFGWKLTANSASGYDAHDDLGARFQIKARRLRSEASGERQLGVMRQLPSGTFDYLAAVLFGRDFSVRRAAIVPFEIVLQRSVHTGHVNGWRFGLDDSMWLLDGVEDATQALRDAASAIDGAARAVS